MIMKERIEDERLQGLARQIRRDSIRMTARAGSGHPGGAMGAAEIFAVLYGSVLRFNSRSNAALGPDRFILSNGHICAGWYSALSLTGFISREELKTHRKMGSRLQGHPSKHRFPEVVETSTGPLGQGFSVASGIAMGKRMRGEPGAVYCLTGDGEMQEGLIWETVMSAAHHRLSSLILIISDNDIQIDGRTSRVKKVRPLNRKFEAFDWQVFNVDGHDIAALRDAFERAAEDSKGPSCIIAETIMAKGVSFMEGDPKWHGSCPSKQETVNALDELGKVDFLEDF